MTILDLIFDLLQLEIVCVPAGLCLALTNYLQAQIFFLSQILGKNLSLGKMHGTRVFTEFSI